MKSSTKELVKDLVLARAHLKSVADDVHSNDDFDRALDWVEAAEAAVDVDGEGREVVREAVRVAASMVVSAREWGVPRRLVDVAVGWEQAPPRPTCTCATERDPASPLTLHLTGNYPLYEGALVAFDLVVQRLATVISLSVGDEVEQAGSRWILHYSPEVFPPGLMALRHWAHQWMPDWLDEPSPVSPAVSNMVGFADAGLACVLDTVSCPEHRAALHAALLGLLLRALSVDLPVDGVEFLRTAVDDWMPQ